MRAHVSHFKCFSFKFESIEHDVHHSVCHFMLLYIQCGFVLCSWCYLVTFNLISLLCGYVCVCVHLCVLVCFLFPVDIWSVGCIMGEMVKGSVIFQGTDRILHSSHRLCAGCCPSSCIVIHSLSNISSLVGLPAHSHLLSCWIYNLQNTQAEFKHKVLCFLCRV